MEASNSLGLEDEMAADWEKIDELEKKQRTLKELLSELKESKSVYTEVMNGADDAIEDWDKLKDALDAGETVYPPGGASKKRKRSAEPSKSRKKSKALHSKLYLCSCSSSDSTFVFSPHSRLSHRR